MRSRNFVWPARDVRVIAHNIRSLYNLGAIFRTAEGFGISKIYLSGYTPAPDKGLAHIRAKNLARLHKTALGAEQIVPFQSVSDVLDLIKNLKKAGWRIAALEQSPRAVNLNDYAPPNKIALLLGEEVHGVAPEILAKCDDVLEIPMRGQKESFNVAVAAGIALHRLTTW
ncbi:MAG: TrmH family RNA methyltransferase [Candidatus Nomurabacteria bacterium]|jgi:tRNA G18 (ribose-2'-O)-methylase SpoU|nr:TrmH family RNA methyltransferase [Candidatus Nomurabacteria bacterium]